MSVKRVKGKKAVKNGGGPSEDSLQDLTADVVRSPEASVEDLPTVVDMATTEALDQKLEQDAGKVTQWATTALTWLANYDASIQAKRDRFADEAEKYRKTLAGLLNHENTTIRRAAWLALFIFRFGQTHNSHADVAQLLANMVKSSQLVLTTGEGSIAAQGKRYNFPLDSCFEEEHVIQIQQAFRAMLTRVWAAVREQWKAKMETLPRLATISLDDLAAGNPGVCVIDVPAQVTKGDEEDERPLRLEGGRLVVNSDGEKIIIVDVVNEVKGWGNFEHSVRDAMALRPPLFLKVVSLSWDKPPFIKDMPDHGRKAKLLWYAIKRAMEHAKLTGELLAAEPDEPGGTEQTDDKGKETALESSNEVAAS